MLNNIHQLVSLHTNQYISPLFTEIDRINILQASLLAMKTAIEDVLKINIKNTGDEDRWYALIDGNKCPNKLTIKSKPFVRGDSLVYPIALASIVAKVERDHLMVSHTFIKTFKPYNPICKGYYRFPFQKIDILFCF